MPATSISRADRQPHRTWPAPRQAAINHPAQDDHYEPLEEVGIIGRSPCRSAGVCAGQDQMPVTQRQVRCGAHRRAVAASWFWRLARAGRPIR
jgi:hypothetical protein